MKRGFTLIELLIVIGIIVILATMSAGAFTQFYRGTILQNQTEIVLSIFENARAKTLFSEGGINYSVHLESDRITLFVGSVYNVASATNEVTLLNPKVTLTTIIVGGGNDIVYRRLTGGVAANGTTTISLISDASKFKELVITKTGIIE